MTYISPNTNDIKTRSQAQAKLDADKAAYFARAGKITVVSPDQYDRNGFAPMREKIEKEIIADRVAKIR
jgi:hypothetical protein